MSKSDIDEVLKNHLKDVVKANRLLPTCTIQRKLDRDPRSGPPGFAGLRQSHRRCQARQRRNRPRPWLKDRVLREGFRVLKPGGKLAVSGAVVRATFPCRSAAGGRVYSKLAKSGFVDIEIEPMRLYNIEDARTFLSREAINVYAIATRLQDKFMSVFVRAKNRRQRAVHRAAAERLSGRNTLESMTPHSAVPSSLNDTGPVSTRFLLALDEGTTSARAALYDEQGQRIALEAVSFPSQYPHPGWVEQDAEEIWRAQLDAARRSLGTANISADAITALGITNQRETTVVWDRGTGKPAAPAIVWQCRRTGEYCTALAASKEAAAITQKTGLVIDAYFSGSKVRWILENVPDAKQKARDGELLFGTVDSWLIWKLTEGAVHVTDVSNASRTMLMNLGSGDWDAALLDIFGIPKAMLPEIVPSSKVVGTATASHFGAEIPIAGIAGDQQAALFGQACHRPGLSKNTYGTGCFALMHTGAREPVSKHKLLATRAASIDASAQFAIEGSIFIAGAAVQWLRDKLGLIGTAAESAQVASSIETTDGVYVVPAFVGLGSPHWDPDARGLVTGVTQGTGRAEIVRATLESIAYQTRELVEAMEADSGEALQELRVDGGAAANDFLMQFQADILGKRIVRPQDTETTALGAAYLAGLATGFFRSLEEIDQFWRVERVFEPLMQDAQREELYAGWKKAVARCRFQDTRVACQ